MPKKKEESFFVGIEDSAEVRREVLEASRRVVEIMQRYERFKTTRKKKMDEIGKLKNVLFDIDKLNTKLKSVLPKTSIRIPHRIEKKVIMPVEEGKHLESLDNDLREIEDKLSALER